MLVTHLNYLHTKWLWKTFFLSNSGDDLIFTLQKDKGYVESIGSKDDKSWQVYISNDIHLMMQVNHVKHIELELM